MAHGEDATGSADAFAADDESTVVQGTVFEEDVFEQSLTDVGIQLFAGANIFVEAHAAFNHYEGTHFLLGHADASHHDGHDVLALHRGLLAAGEETQHGTSPPLCADGREEVADFFLEKNDQSQSSQINHLVEYGTHEAHLKNLRGHKPNQEKNDDAHQHVGGT